MDYMEAELNLARHDLAQAVTTRQQLNAMRRISAWEFRIHHERRRRGLLRYIGIWILSSFLALFADPLFGSAVLFGGFLMLFVYVMVTR